MLTNTSKEILLGSVNARKQRINSVQEEIDHLEYSLKLKKDQKRILTKELERLESDLKHYG